MAEISIAKRPFVHVGVLFTNEDEEPETYGWKIEQDGFATPEERLEGWNAYKADELAMKRKFLVNTVREMKVGDLVTLLFCGAYVEEHYISTGIVKRN